MFGRRPDATLVRDLPTVRAFMPFVSPRRNESVVYYTDEVDPEPALAFIEEYNRTAPEDRQLSLFTLLLRSIALALPQRPACNRFVAGSRLWQRHDVWLTFSAKMELVDRSPIVTVKRRFDEDQGLADMLEGILGRLTKRRGGEKTSSDKEMHLALRVLPPFLIRGVIWLLHQTNQLGLLPKKLIDDDPLFTSVFVASLGSVGMDAGYHHLWEYGTASIFVMMGKIKERPGGGRYFELKYTYDERIEDGLYGGIGMQIVKDGLEHPEKLL